MKEIIAEITPSDLEESEMQARAAALITAVNNACKKHGFAANATVQGSVAKGTWLRQSVDLDCFVLLPSTAPEEDLKRLAETIGPEVLENPMRKYAQHPYLVGEFQGAQVDLVPAYEADYPANIQSAVDRTPFHTKWVNENLTKAQKQDLRLLKAWCKGTGIYGAETKIGGFSGYLLEVLVAWAGSMEIVLEWLRVASNLRIAIGPDDVNDDVAHLVVVDPVDPTRNCAAAVTKETFEAASAAAIAYQSPSRLFYHPNSPNRENLPAALQAEAAEWTGLTLAPEAERMDIVFPQFQRGGRMFAEGLERLGFPVIRASVTELDGIVAMQWVTKKVQQPLTTLQRGPLASKPDNVAKFKAKWQDHVDRAGEFEEIDGKMHVLLHNRIQTPADAIALQIKKGGYAKHLQAALKKHAILGTPEEAPAGWNISDCIRNEYPWMRTS